jgi:hypothetical protein
VSKGNRREILVKWKEYKEEIWEPREEFLKTKALAQFKRKFGTENRVGEKDSGLIIGPKSCRQRGKSVKGHAGRGTRWFRVINSLY